MSFAAAALLEFLGLAVLVPALALGVAVRLGGRRRLVEPGIEGFMGMVVLAVVALALVFVVPFAVAFSSLGHRETGLMGIFLAVLVLLGAGYAWRVSPR